MGEQWMQFVAAGLTSGAIYALVALGFSIVYNASHAINFAQGEFVMVGGMAAVSLVGFGLPLWPPCRWRWRRPAGWAWWSRNSPSSRRSARAVPTW